MYKRQLKDGSVFYAEEKNNEIFSDIFLNFSISESKKSENFLTAKKSFVSSEDPNLVLFEDGQSFSKDGKNQVKMSFELLSMNAGKNFFLGETSNQKNVNEVQLFGLNNIWKMSLPLLTLIAVFLALPLSKIKPRQGRYSKVLPCLIVFLVYLGLLLLVKGWLDEGRITFAPSLLLVHLSFLLLGLILMSKFSPLRTD